MSQQDTQDPARPNNDAEDDVPTEQDGRQLPAQEEGGEQQQSWIASIFKTVLVYLVLSVLMRGGVPTPNSEATKESAKPGLAPKDSSAPAVFNGMYVPQWSENQLFDLRVFMSPDANPDLKKLSKENLLWRSKGIEFSWNDTTHRHANLSMPVTYDMRNNGSLYAHIFATPVSTLGKRKFSPKLSSVLSCPLISYYKPVKKDKKKNLLSSEEDPKEEEPKTEADGNSYLPIAFWHPTLHIRLVLDRSVFRSGQVPPHVMKYLNIVNDSTPIQTPPKGDSKTKEYRPYKPIIYCDRFWELTSHRFPVNETTGETLGVQVEYSPISLLRWQMQLHMDESWKKQKASGMGSAGDQEEIKRMMLETNPYLLALTVIVSILHMVFDCLAFKSDIQFWQQKRSMVGLSVRTIGLNTVCQVIIFLYLMDQDTSWVVLFSSGVGLLIQFWKLTKAMDITFDTSRYPYIFIKGKNEYVESETEEHDRVAMRYLSYALYPLVACYAVYSLFYEEHKNVYSWVLGSLVGSVYMFGFIMMCPQLYLNYKLKSVAHLPWRMLTYKALNTFIDDMFAFIIKMPTLHRLSCFRDDLVFFIYLYQRWVYKTDYTRANEFGLVPDLDSTDTDKDEGEAQPPLESEEKESETIKPTDGLRRRKVKQKIEDEWVTIDG